MNTIKEVITPKEAAQRLGRTQHTIEHGLRTGELPFGTAFRQASGRFVYIIPREAFERFLRGEIRAIPYAVGREEHLYETIRPYPSRR